MKVESLGEQGGAGQLVFAEIVRMHFRKDVLNEAGVPDATKLDLVGRCGGDYYVRANEASLFTVPKPLGVMGMGVDALPEDIRTSHVLTGNHSPCSVAASRCLTKRTSTSTSSGAGGCIHGARGRWCSARASVA